MTAAALAAGAARALLVRAQRVSGPEREAPSSVAETVRAVTGLQAQDLHAASLGVRARRVGSNAGEVERARVEERSVARVWCMRGTLHLVAAEDARWLVELLGPVGLARGRRRRAELGVSAPAAVAAVREALADGPLTRHEVAAEVRAAGVRLAEDPQVPVHLVACAALEGHVCEAGARDGTPLYALAEHWLGPPAWRPGRETALAELARRHAAAHPPAAPEDLAAWSGLGLRDARRGFAAVAPELEEVRVGGRAGWVRRGAEPAAPGSVRLMPAFDGLLLGHRDRALTVRPEHARDVLPGGGIVRPTLLIDGRVEGTWRLQRGRPGVEPFAPPSPELAAAIEAEAADVVRHRGG